VLECPKLLLALIEFGNRYLRNHATYVYEAIAHICVFLLNSVSVACVFLSLYILFFKITFWYIFGHRVRFCSASYSWMHEDVSPKWPIVCLEGCEKHCSLTYSIQLSRTIRMHHHPKCNTSWLKHATTHKTHTLTMSWQNMIESRVNWWHIHLVLSLPREAMIKKHQYFVSKDKPKYQTIFTKHITFVWLQINHMHWCRLMKK